MISVNNLKKTLRIIKRNLFEEKSQEGLKPLLEQQNRQFGDSNYRVALYFSDGLVNSYQIDQWYDILVKLHQELPVVIITRKTASAYYLLEKGELPVQFFRNIAAVEEWVSEQPDLHAVLYVNQNILNFQMMRLRQPAHVFMSHGESDKDYMASNQIKAYDYTFIAGQAAHDRIASLVHNYDVDHRTIRIGRPQVDIDYPGPALPKDERITVLYAPTWEGDRPSMRYSSIISHGVTLVEQLLTDPRFRIIYRPHPRTGVNLNTFTQASKKIQSLIEESNKKDPNAQHLVDTETTFGWHLKAADVCIADISAVAYDWLATGKPLLVTTPDHEDAVIEPNGITSRLPQFAAPDARNVIAAIDNAFGHDSKIYAETAQHYFGDTHEGASLESFMKAVRQVVQERETEISKLLS